MGNQIVFPENNQLPRDLFSCGQSKQAVSVYHSNFKNRIDKSGLILNYGQIPLVKSRYMKYINNEEHPYGEIVICDIMCYGGYNVEDSILFNEGSIKRGLFRTTYYNMYEDYESSSKIGDSNIDSEFMNIENNPVLGLREGYDYSKLDEKTGLIREETVVNEKTIVIGNMPQTLKLTQVVSGCVLQIISFLSLKSIKSRVTAPVPLCPSCGSRILTLKSIRSTSPSEG